MEAPVPMTRPKRILELMLDIEEPNGDRGADRHHRAMHKKERPDAYEPDHESDNPRYRRVRSHRAEPGLQPGAHETHRNAIVQHEQISRDRAKHDIGASVQPVGEPT